LKNNLSKTNLNTRRSIGIYTGNNIVSADGMNPINDDIPIKCSHSHMIPKQKSCTFFVQLIILISDINYEQWLDIFVILNHVEKRRTSLKVSCDVFCCVCLSCVDWEISTN